MRLLSSKQGGGFELSTFNANDPPPYAILSHTWLEGEEVAYNELVAGEGKNKAGYAKLQFCGDKAAKDGLNYFWVDTCCINKQDNNELNTALNSMFRWYQRATKCYVYLSDVHVPDEVTDVQAFRITWEDAFRRSRWFRRGWTLQELVAPASVEFFSANGKQLGSKVSLEQEIHEITQIPITALRKYDLREFSIDERMSWVADRKTTVVEDKVYCLLGIFGVFLPLIYGEGEEHAFRRLRKEIQGQSESLDNIAAAKNISVSSLLPFPRNETFVGREDHLRTLEERLYSSHTHRRMSLYGLGGVGKTAVALELAYRMITKRPQFLVFWVPAINRETFEIAYREIGTLLGIQGITDDNANIKQLVKDGLNSGGFGDWLMIIDNADDPSVLLDSTNDGPQSGQLYEYLPRSNRGSILFTTRGRKAAERLTQNSVLVLEDMSKVEAKRLMAWRITNKTLLNDENATSELLELLTYLPLAIVQATAFINTNQVSISDYMSLFKQADTEVEVFSERFDDPSRYRETENTIAKTWQISFNQIMKQDQLAADYLSFIACIDCVNIPQSLLPHEGTAVQRIKALGTLTGYAFISELQQPLQQLEEERFFDVHRLVQKATVWWLKEHNDWTVWTEKVYCRLERLVPYGGHEGRQKWISYLPHAMHVSGLSIELSDTRRASLLDRIGRCQATLGQYAAAEATHRQVFSLRRENLGNENASTIISINQMGLVLHDQGRYEEAETMHRQALALNKKVLSKEHPFTLTSMNNLALVLDKQSKYEEAETIFRQTLALREKVLSKEHPDTLMSMNNLAGVLDQQGKYEEAEMMHRQTLALNEKVLSKEHPSTLTSMNNLAGVLGRQGKYEEAETMYRQTLALREKVLSKEHPDTLISMNNLAGVLDSQGKYEEAETMNRQTLALKEKVFSKDHPSTLTSMNNLARVLDRQNKYEEAEMMHRQTLLLKKKVLSKDHPSTLTSMSNLAGVLDRQGKYEEAETIYRQTLALREKVFNKEHPDTLLSVYYLAQFLAKQGLCVEAATLYQRACEGHSKVLRDDHPTARACRQHYLEMLQGKEQSELIVTGEPSRTVTSNKESGSEDGIQRSQTHRMSRLSRGLAKLSIKASKQDK